MNQDLHHQWELEVQERIELDPEYRIEYEQWLDSLKIDENEEIEMGTIAKDSGGKEFEKCPEGNHVARCYQVIDLGLQETPWGAKHKVRLAFELPNELMTEGEQAGKPFSVSNNYTISLHEKATLRKHLESWRGRSFTDEELAGFDVKNVLGKPCMVQVLHTRKDDKTYANIASISSLPKGMEPPEPVNPTLYVDAETISDAEFSKLPEWMQKKINRTGEVDTTHSMPTDHPFDDDIQF